MILPLIKPEPDSPEGQTGEIRAVWKRTVGYFERGESRDLMLCKVKIPHKTIIFIKRRPVLCTQPL